MKRIWLLVVATFVIGDVGTTVLGLRTPGVVEQNALPRVLLNGYGMVLLLVVKATFTVCAYLVYRWMNSHSRIGIPLGLILVGSVVTVWNAYVITIV